ncbi:MAG: RluA family pseudouridine synthase [Chitinophagales bacterium]|jgi:23S rRNA pseudouridine955/2504/2580 synthase/23S rRNA pseudouridine1911/1915/1917 synthase|nr:RluA family pseudouridine synthase [Chitinophagales bacterium]
MKIDIIYEDEHFIAINKDSGVLSIRDRSDSEANLFDSIKDQYDDLRIIHRIDKPTSGLILFAKGLEAQREITKLMNLHQISKTYHALVAGQPQAPQGEIDVKISEITNPEGQYFPSFKGRDAKSTFETIQNFKGLYSLLSFRIETGRTHQIRVHSKFIGCPLAYDPIYNPNSGIYLSRIKAKYKQNKEDETSLIKRLSLHSYEMAFVHPFSKEPLVIKAPYKKDFETVLKILQRHT